MKLINAQEMATKYPKYFESPSVIELSQIKKGDFVKVCDNQERFWVKVTKKSKDLIKGKISNHLLSVQRKFGDEIILNTCNIYDIQKVGK